MSRKRSRAGGEVPDESVLLYKELPPASLHSTICLELFGSNQREPVTLSVCGHSFCRECANSSLTAKRQCPNCRSECARTGAVSSLMVPNFSVKDALDELRVHCRFGLGELTAGRRTQKAALRWSRGAIRSRTSRSASIGGSSAGTPTAPRYQFLCFGSLL